MVGSARPLPPAAVVVRFPVASFDAWKAVFDENEPARRAAGIVGHHINRAADDPNLVSVYMAVQDVPKAKAFTTSDELKGIMQKAGVKGEPEMIWMVPVREEVVWDRELPAIIVSHRVADFDRWLEGYDRAAELQRSKGIVGHAANRSMDDPSVAIVYHQAESFDVLRAFLDDPELQDAMQAAGVSSEPEVSFHTGDWAKFYE